MNNNNNSFNILLVAILEIIVLVTCVSYILSDRWNKVIILSLCVVCLAIPFVITWIANRKKVMLPLSFQTVILLFIFFSLYFGETKDYYFKFGWYDTTLHAIAGCYGVIVGINLVKGIIKKGDEITNKRFIFFIVSFAFSFSIALGTIWEAFEYVGDRLIKTDMIKEGAKDTETDIMANVIADSITTVICYFNKIKNKIV